VCECDPVTSKIKCADPLGSVTDEIETKAIVVTATEGPACHWVLIGERLDGAWRSKDTYCFVYADRACMILCVTGELFKVVSAI
jgi:hypothetical protein